MKFAFRLASFFALFLIIIAVSTARETESHAGVEGIRVVDSFGREVTLEAPAGRVVSLSPGITETVYALGYASSLVGRTSFCDYPKEVSSITVAGTLSDPDVETILVLKPDIVIASTHFPEEALERLENLGLKVAVFMGQESFHGTYNGVIRPVATVLGDIEAGERLVAEMEATVETALSKASTINNPPKVYYVIGFSEGGDWTAGGDTFIGEMIRMAGGINIAEDVHGWSFSKEALVERNPDIIILPYWADGIFQTTALYADLPAVQEGRTYVIDENMIDRQGPRLALGFLELVNIIGGSH